MPSVVMMPGVQSNNPIVLDSTTQTYCVYSKTRLVVAAESSQNIAPFFSVEAIRASMNMVMRQGPKVPGWQELHISVSAAAVKWTNRAVIFREKGPYVK
mmetsp:Transcript_7675/g.12239  ORF Transcript_7675/g.12239 Transcript_7675/m.12239 type:complete len:99 (+) Transcript_7675:148-444(+)